MTKLKYTLFIILMLSIGFPGFSQTTVIEPQKSEKKIQRAGTEDEPRTDGLKRISTRLADEDDFDIDIDEEAFEANIERVVERAMSSVEVALERLETNMESIEVNLEDLHPIEIQIPELNLEPFEVDLGDLDIDIDIDENRFNWSGDAELDIEEDEFIQNTIKKKSKSDKEKSRGLKKIN